MKSAGIMKTSIDVLAFLCKKTAIDQMAASQLVVDFGECVSAGNPLMRGAEPVKTMCKVKS